MPRLQRRSFDKPDHVRDLGAGRMVVIDLDETSIGRMKFEPGWRWSQDVAPTGVFRPFGGFADGIPIERGFVRPPEAPGIGYELKSDPYAILRDLH